MKKSILFYLILLIAFSFSKVNAKMNGFFASLGLSNDSGVAKSESSVDLKPVLDPGQTVSILIQGNTKFKPSFDKNIIISPQIGGGYVFSFSDSLYLMLEASLKTGKKTNTFNQTFEYKVTDNADPDNVVEFTQLIKHSFSYNYSASLKALLGFMVNEKTSIYGGLQINYAKIKWKTSIMDVFNPDVFHESSTSLKPIFGDIVLGTQIAIGSNSNIYMFGEFATTIYSSNKKTTFTKRFIYNDGTDTEAADFTNSKQSKFSNTSVKVGVRYFF